MNHEKIIKLRGHVIDQFTHNGLDKNTISAILLNISGRLVIIRASTCQQKGALKKALFCCKVFVRV